MITMIEGIPSKITGFTSIYIQFDFNQDIVDTIKSECEVFNYSKKTHIWEVPVRNISHLIDLLSVFDDISIISLPDNKNATETLVDPLKFKTKPFKYQLDGINYGVNHKKWLLLDDMGLGKTLQAIYVAQELKERHNLKHCMIICGVDSLRSNWKREIEKHSNLDAMILGDRVTKRGTIKYESVSKRAEQLLNDINEFFIITTLTTIRNDDVVSAFNQKHNQIDMIILDEAQKCICGDALIKTNLGDISIKDIVDNKIDCEVLSLNTKTNNYEYKKIIDYYNNGVSNDVLELEIEENDNIYKLKCTSNHKVFTRNRGFVLAKELTEDDDIVII